jgi:hypothetical protein
MSSPAQDAVLVAEAQRNPFASERELKAATNFLGQRYTIIFRLKEAGLRAWHAVVKAVLNNEHKLHCLAFAKSSVDCQWDRFIFSDKSTFSSANDGLVLVYRPWGEHYSSQYVLTSTCSGCVLIAGAGSPTKGQKYSTIQKST